ncbi:MAG: sugar phosphate isomerase/epimerase [Clostridia bacterium]|nr:sugar phosphate isomerase/epimerase [Clostridia bacterium]
MKLSVFLHHVLEAGRQEGWTLPEALRWVQHLGISLVEIDGDAGEDWPSLKGQLKDAGLGVSSVYAMYDWSRNPADLRDFHLLKAAEALGSPLVMPIPGLYGEGSRAEQDARFLEGMAALCAEAERRGLTPTMEDYDNVRSPIAVIAGMKRFTDAIPGLTVTLDTGNFLFSGEDVLEAQSVFSGRIAHAHLKDRLLTPPAKTPDHPGLSTPTGIVLWPCAVGGGCIPLGEVLRRLKASKYAGALTIEHFDVRCWRKTIEESAAWVKTAWEAA